MRWWVGFIVGAVACSDGTPAVVDDAGAVDAAAGPRDAGPHDAGVDDATVRDGGPNDGGPRDGGPRDAGTPDGAARDAGPTDGGDLGRPLAPIPGELAIHQLDLPPGLTLRLGEAAVVIGPAGSLLLLDVGNSNHDDEVRAVIRDLNTNVLTPARGYPARSPLQVEWIVLTHFHGDHVGAFRDLTAPGADALVITEGVVHRGFVDLGDGMNTNDYEEVCDRLTTTLAAQNIPLCESAVPAPCTYSSLVDPHAAIGCPGLLRTIDLDGATITFVLANGHTTDGTSTHVHPPFGHADNNEENARSVGGIIEYGAFRYWFGGDITGTGDPTEPDIESHVVTNSAPFMTPLGFDVVHTHHHARRTSSNATFVAATVPMDGRDRNVVAGINAAHVGSPHDDVVERWTNGGRLGAGRFWITTSAPGGADESTHPALVVADGPVLIQTSGTGARYHVQANGPAIRGASYDAVR